MEHDTSEATRSLHERIGTLVQSYRDMNELAARAPLGFLSADFAQDKQRSKPQWMPSRDNFDHALLQAEAHDIALRKRQIDAMLQDAHQPVFGPFDAQADLNLSREVRSRISQIDAEIVAFVEDAFAFRARQAKDEAREDARARARRRHPMAREDKENTVISTFEPIAPWMGPEAWARVRHPADAKEPPKPPKILQTKKSKAPSLQYRRPRLGSAASAATSRPDGKLAAIEDPGREQPVQAEEPAPKRQLTAHLVDCITKTLGPRESFARFASVDATGSVLAQCQLGSAAGRDLWTHCIVTASASYLQSKYAYRACVQEVALEALLDEGVIADDVSDMLTLLEQTFDKRDAGSQCILRADSCMTLIALAHQRVSASGLPLSAKGALTGLLSTLKVIGSKDGASTFASAVRASQGVQLAMLGQAAPVRAHASIQAASAIFAQAKCSYASPGILASLLASVQGTALGFARGSAPLGDLEVSAMATAICAHCAQQGYPLQEAGQAAVRAALTSSLHVRAQIQQGLNEAVQMSMRVQPSIFHGPMAIDLDEVKRLNSSVEAGRIDHLLGGESSTAASYESLRKVFYGSGSPLEEKEDDDEDEEKGAERFALGAVDAVAARLLVEVAAERASSVAHLDDQRAVSLALDAIVQRMQDLLRVHHGAKSTSELQGVRVPVSEERGVEASLELSGEAAGVQERQKYHDGQDLLAAKSATPNAAMESIGSPEPLRPSVAQLESYLRSSVLAEVLVQEANANVGSEGELNESPMTAQGDASESTVSPSLNGGGGVVQWFMDRGEAVDQSAVKAATAEAISKALGSSSASPEDTVWDLDAPSRPWSDGNILDLVTNLVLAQVYSEESENDAALDTALLGANEAPHTKSSKDANAQASEQAANAALASRLAAEAAERAIFAREESVRLREVQLLEQERTVALREAEARASAAQSALGVKEAMLERLVAETSARHEMLAEQERGRVADLEATLAKFGQLQLETLGMAFDRMQHALPPAPLAQDAEIQRVVSLATQTDELTPLEREVSRGEVERHSSEVRGFVAADKEVDLLERKASDGESKSPSESFSEEAEIAKFTKEEGGSNNDDSGNDNDGDAESGENFEGENDMEEEDDDEEGSLSLVLPYPRARNETKDVSLLDLSAVVVSESPRASSLDSPISLMLPAEGGPAANAAASPPSLSPRIVTPRVQPAKEPPAKGFSATLLEWSDSDDEEEDIEAGDDHSADSRSLSEGELEVSPGDFSDGEEVPLTIAYRSALQPAVTGAPWPPGQMPNLDAKTLKTADDAADVSLASSASDLSLSNLSMN
ncbi:Hypothetical Protein FCC1311_025182 [Hondaea fermentalgiana]|uniref:Uncharacterized protein n=1 Tax=Hondaea fermentalgiana TaxID=2315210 RepID=A0A2R5G5I2_9STRA|nr:Hypothetical Protein FCC1311_025182 [Hondaea fermentalgiana]|eukprot:GBG26297.1 Hypothetical Protein FCC1311_025182 [Hondaea fermentalgiana]